MQYGTLQAITVSTWERCRVHKWEVENMVQVVFVYYWDHV